MNLMNDEETAIELDCLPMTTRLSGSLESGVGVVVYSLSRNLWRRIGDFPYGFPPHPFISG